MSSQQKLALGFLLWGIFATTVHYIAYRLVNPKPKVITLDVIMTMPTHDCVCLRSYEVNS
jgi:hypothetical protein